MNTCCNQDVFYEEDMKRWSVCCSTPLVPASNFYTKAEIDEKLEDIEISGDCMSSGDVQNMIDASVSPIEGSVEALSGAVEQLSSDLENKADRSEIPSLSGYATQQWVENQGYLTEHQPLKTINGQVISGTGNITISGSADLSNYYTKSQVDFQMGQKQDKLNYYTEGRYPDYAEIEVSPYYGTSIKVDSHNIDLYYNSETGHANLDNSPIVNERNLEEILNEWLEGYQVKLEAGTGIDITNNVISCTVSGGGGGDMSNYYTKAQTNDLLDDKLDASAYTPSDLSNYWTSAQTQNAIDDAISGITGITIDQSLDSGSTNAVANSAITQAINAKADASDVYTKTEVNNVVNNKFWCGTQSEYDALVNKENGVLYLIYEN